MTAQRNRQWILMRRPVGEIREGDLVLREDPIRTPAAGEVVVRNEWLSLDPANRVYMSDVKQYMPPVPLGDPMRGFICGTVAASAAPGFAVGANVMGLGTWSEYSCVPAAYLMPVPEVPGLTRKDVFGQGYIVAPTALLGLRHIGSPKAGETMVVSAAVGGSRNWMMSRKGTGLSPGIFMNTARNLRPCGSPSPIHVRAPSPKIWSAKTSKPSIS
jgi:NADPH-dependent curcumin reductase